MKKKLLIFLIALLSLIIIPLNKFKASEPLGTCRTNLYDYYANYTEAMCDEIGGGWSPYDVPYVPEYDNDGNRVMNWSDYDEIIEEDGQYYGIIEVETKFLWLQKPNVNNAYTPTEIRSQLFLGFNYSLNDLLEIEIVYDRCDMYLLTCFKKILDKKLIIADDGSRFFTDLILNYDQFSPTYENITVMIEKMREESLSLSDFDYLVYLPLTDTEVIGDKISIVRLKYELGEPVYDDDGNLIADDGDVIDEILQDPVDVENSSDDGDISPFEEDLNLLFGESFVSKAKEIVRKLLIGIILIICVLLCVVLIIALSPLILPFVPMLISFIRIVFVSVIKLIFSPLVLVLSLLRKSNVKKQFR